MKARDDHHSVADLTGEYYHLTLMKLHNVIRPKVYLEIGTEHGETLALADCSAIAVDPEFKFRSSEILTKFVSREFLCLHQVNSDDFFAHQRVLTSGSARPLFVFLDGMHHCEATLRDFINVEVISDNDTIVAIHDIAPVEIGMTSRVQYPSPTPTVAHRLGWWTGDVWKFALLLRQKRPDLRIVVLDCYPTGLMLVGNLNCDSGLLRGRYAELCDEMAAMSLETMGVAELHRSLQLIPASTIDTFSDIHHFLMASRV